MRIRSEHAFVALVALAALILRPAWLHAQPVQTNLVSLSATWRYNHADCLDGTGWTATLYNDTGPNWLSGPGGFTGGETRAEALLGVTTTSLPAPNAAGRSGRAMYFRTTFNVASTAALSLIFSNRVDDNAAFYLNGQLVQRLRLTADPILCGSFGTINPYGNSDATDWDVFTLAPAQLSGLVVAGTNTLAVEVHQPDAGSSDMVFVCAVTASIADTNPPATLVMPPTPPQYGYRFVPAFPGANFTDPVAVHTPPGETNRLFVVEQDGRIGVITNLAAPNRTLFLDIVARVSGGVPTDERGLLGMAFHPGYATNGKFYVFYTTTTTSAQGANALHDRLSQFTVSASNPNAADGNSELVLFEQHDEAGNHNGGDLHFGPDGYLYVSLGDEGGGNDQYANSQRIDRDFFAGLMRIDVDNRAGSLMPNPHPANTNNPLREIRYRIPADNPWIGVTSFNGSPVAANNVRTEFYAVGLRNPWRFSFDAGTGDLYLADVGQNVWEEVNLVRRGGNYGWSYREGLHAGPRGNPPAGVVLDQPIAEYAHGSGPFQGFSISGGVVYRGHELPDLHGAYIFADYVSGNVWMLRANGTNVVPLTRLSGDNGIAGFGVDPRNGDVLTGDQSEDTLKRLVFDPTVEVGTLPPTLADTGAFTNLNALTNSTQALTANAGLHAYDLNAPFWSDGASKSRWFFMATNGAKVGFAPEGNWTLPAGMAWVKHFDLQFTNGAPDSVRRLETRVLVRTSNSVYGVTYRWGDSMTNATLVPEGGLDESFVIHDGSQVRTQIWRYPSRSDCQACHTAGGGWALGFNTAQLNREFGYAGGVSNQLAFLSAAGLFSNAVTDVHSLRALAPVTDESSSLEWRVRSYLAANCASCHLSGGTALGHWTAALTNSTALAGLIHGPLVNNGGNPNARVVVPGSLTNSMLLTRISTRGPGQMPPIGSTVPDAEAMALLSRWITNDLAGGWTNTIAPFTIALSATNGGTVQFMQPANRAARVETATSLEFPISWSFLNVPENRPTYPATTNAVSINDPAGAAQKFYRVRLTAP